MNDPIERAEYLLRTVALFIEEHPVRDYSIFYDEAECDGTCLQDDCIAAANELKDMRTVPKP